MIFIALFLPLLVWWIYLEKKNAEFSTRIVSGLACITLCLITLFVTQIMPGYERKAHKFGMQHMERVLTNGETQVVIRALQTYNTIAATNSTYSAAMDMNRVLFGSVLDGLNMNSSPNIKVGHTNN